MVDESADGYCGAPASAYEAALKKATAPREAVPLTDDAIGEVLTGILRRAEAEYQTMTQADLEQRWYFRFDPAQPLAWNLYRFNGCLTLYAGSCRRWEEIHHGSCCVVERVRDTYLMPKIKEFEQVLRSALT